jgi:hypothetical protein
VLTESFESIELAARQQATHMLGKTGFDARHDVLVLTVNRWARGYTCTYDTLADPDLPERG